VTLEQREGLGRSKETGNVAVVPARVHDTVDLRAISGLVDLHNRECVDIRPKRNRFVRTAALEQAYDASATNTRPHRAPERGETISNDLRGTVLFK